MRKKSSDGRFVWPIDRNVEEKQWFIIQQNDSLLPISGAKERTRICVSSSNLGHTIIFCLVWNPNDWQFKFNAKFHGSCDECDNCFLACYDIQFPFPPRWKQSAEKMKKNWFSFVVLLIFSKSLGCDIFAQVPVSQVLVWRNSSGFRKCQISNTKWGKINFVLKQDPNQSEVPTDEHGQKTTGKWKQNVWKEAEMKGG